MTIQSPPIQVVNRLNEKVDLDISKIRNVVSWACEGLDADPLVLESSMSVILKEGITTKEIQDNLIENALQLTNPKASDWRYVAGRLYMWGLTEDVKASRGLGYIIAKDRPVSTYEITVSEMIENGRYCTELVTKYNLDELNEAGKWINPEWDKDYDYAGAVLLGERYLLKDELPQEAYLTCALLLASNEEKNIRLNIAKQFYEAIAKRKISLATPILANLRVPDGSLSSCFIIAMDDNLESIFGEITNAARISKNGGGVGCNISRVRGVGSTVMGRENASGGVIPWIKLLNDTAIAVDQAGSRSGAITVGLDIWHLDIPEFLEMQAENGDRRRKAYDVFPQVIICDEFMRRVQNKEKWTLVDPYEVKQKLGIDLSQTWGESFEQAYSEIESQLDEKITLYKRVDARELFKHIMRSQIETGMPYLAFKDTINRANPNKHQGYIPGTNLCVAGETKILTDNGQLEIKSLVDEKVNVWNGKEWSEVLIRQTGTNQPLLKVNLSNGESLECTYYHHFWVKDSYNSAPRKVEAAQLKPGDKLIKYELPVVSNESDVELPYAYTAGFYTGDGSFDANNQQPEIDLYHEKRELLPYIDVRAKRRGGSHHSIVLDEPAIYHDVNQKRIVCKLPEDILPKFTVPLNGYTIDSRLTWFAGLVDADGTIARNGSNESLQLASNNKTFLRDVRLLLQTLGVDSKISLMTPEGWQTLPNGYGGHKDYYCQATYRLLINSNGLYSLSQLGFKTNRLVWEDRLPQRKAARFITVDSVEETFRVDDTYCFTEPKRNLGMFNGILTGQCCESYSNVSPGLEAHCCNLVSLNLATIEDDEMNLMCDLAVRMLDNTIDLTTPPIKEAKNHNDKYRTIGVGAMGLADWLAKRQLKYTNLKEISNLFEDIAYHCTFTSTMLAHERGAYPAYEGSEWDKGKMLGAKTLQDILSVSYNPQRWRMLRELIDSCGIRNSHITAIAPNTSSSLVQGCTASILPVYSKFFYDKWAKGSVPIAPPFIKEAFWFYKENKTLDQKVVIDATGVIQQWIDTGISMELLFNLNKGIYFPEEPDRALSAEDIYNCLMLAWQSGCKAVYYVRTVQKDDFKSSDGCASCAN